MLKTISTVVATLAVSGFVSAETYYVAQDGTGDFSSIQLAIDQASNGDEITVGPGTYQENLVIDDGRSLTFTSTDGAATTILDGGSSSNCLYLTGSPMTTISGFTIQNGVATALSGHGGGICVDSGDLTLNSCHVIGNSANWGGGVYMQYGHLIINSCLFWNNSVEIPSHSGELGGAICTGSADLTVSDSQFTTNSCGLGTGGGAGGAIACGFSNDKNYLDVSDSTFNGNYAGENGGAIKTYGSGVSVTIAGSQFTNNTASNGGGVNTDSTPFTCTDSVFTGNEASVVTSEQTEDGGAICSKPPSTSNASFVVSGCTFESNIAMVGAILIADNTSTPLIENCLFRDNEAYTSDPNSGGAAIKINGTSATVKSCTFEENRCPYNGNVGSAIYVWVQTVSYQDSYFCGHEGQPLATWGGGSFQDLGGNTIVETCFVNDAIQWAVADGGNGHWYVLMPYGIHATWSSASEDASARGGYLATLTNESEDEFVTALYTTTGDSGSCDSCGSGTAALLGGQRDSEDEWQWISGEPWDFTNWNDGEPSGGGETVLYLRCPGRWNDGTDNLDGSCRYAAIIEWSADCNGDGIVDYGQIQDGSLEDQDEDGIPDCCESGECLPLDCNDNGIPDTGDLANGTSQDCNGNDIPDECDIADGVSVDCNGNLIPDECESLADCDNDGTPDACEILDGATDENPADGIPDECQGLPVGACCVNGLCSAMTAAQCFALEGNYAGVGISCADANCPTTCAGDVNGDNQVGIIDLLTIIDGWGFCP